jgi:hypothetical protein
MHDAYGSLNHLSPEERAGEWQKVVKGWDYNRNYKPLTVGAAWQDPKEGAQDVKIIYGASIGTIPRSQQEQSNMRDSRMTISGYGRDSFKKEQPSFFKGERLALYSDSSVPQGVRVELVPWKAGQCHEHATFPPHFEDFKSLQSNETRRLYTVAMQRDPGKKTALCDGCRTWAKKLVEDYPGLIIVDKGAKPEEQIMSNLTVRDLNGILFDIL